MNAAPIKRFSRNSLKCLILIGALISCGLGAAFVQTIGWATMIRAELSKTGSVAEAIENTFDGKKPCQFCTMAAELQQSEEPGKGLPAPEPKKSFAKDLTATNSRPLRAPSPEKSHHGLCWLDVSLDSLGATRPPSPPPRAV